MMSAEPRGERAAARRLPQCVSRKDAADAFGVSLRHFIAVIDPELPRIYVGRCVRYDVRDVVELMERRKVRLERRSR